MTGSLAYLIFTSISEYSIPVVAPRIPEAISKQRWKKLKREGVGENKWRQPEITSHDQVKLYEIAPTRVQGNPHNYDLNRLLALFSLLNSLSTIPFMSSWWTPSAC